MQKTLSPLLAALVIFLSLAIFSGCSSAHRNTTPPASSATDKYHLGDHSLPISKSTPEAQQAFDRGLTLAYAFSHKASEREFRRAAELAPESAMPWWGVALVNGPHINFPLVPEENAKVAWDALGEALKRIEGTTPLERALIEALAARYVEKQGKDRSPLDRAYAAAMKSVAQQYPQHADVLALYAESEMDLHPWDFWELDGRPKSWTPEILTTLEQAIEINPKHPGAHHLYIHAVEASTAPELGIKSADILSNLAPGAGHLVHMPAHIYARVGRWEDSSLSNERAAASDAEFRKSNPQPGFYAVYMMHNHHFLSFTRMMQGQFKPAVEASRAMVAGVPPEFLREFGPVADGYMAIVYEVLMRFGKWEELLAEPPPPTDLPLATALWRFTRSSALTALDRNQEADLERKEFLLAVKKVPADATFGNNNAHTLLEIARYVLDGERAARAKRHNEAVIALRKAAKIEDTLRYDEPPDWILPVRHPLGITLLNAGRFEEAEAVYREDLKKFPSNGWSLYGLSRALALQGRSDEANVALNEFSRVWAAADTKINSSCLCQGGA